MKLQLSKRSNRALTLTEVLIVIFILILMACLLLPNLAGSHKSLRIECVSNLKQISLANRIWINDNEEKFQLETWTTNGDKLEFVNGKNAWLNFLVMSNELLTPIVLHCPADKNTFAATNFSDFSNQNISYFFGLNASTNHPQTFLAGDDNFEISGVPVKSGLLEISTNTQISWTAARHKFCGNIALADGSVQEVTQNGLRQALQQTGLATNRLAIP